jgi:hypothetical protein
MSMPAYAAVALPLMLRDLVRQVETRGADAVAAEVETRAGAALTAADRHTLGELFGALAARCR